MLETCRGPEIHCQSRYLQLGGNEYATHEHTHFQKMNIVSSLGANPNLRNIFYWSANIRNENRSMDERTENLETDFFDSCKIARKSFDFNR
jgi:hypothetical protein